MPHETLPRLVRFENSVRNESLVTLRDVRCDALLPEDGPGQRVRWLRLSGHDWTIGRDALGQRFARAGVARLRPGETVTFAWLAAVELTPQPVRGGDATLLTSVARATALADDPALGLGDRAVAEAARDVRRAAFGDSAEALAHAALTYVRKRIDYDLSGGWQTAPDVLRRGTGSCSEMTFVYVAICRRLGIPARWIGGTLERARRGGRSVDDVFHRLAEVRLPGRGWVGVETTSKARTADDGRPFGRLPRAMLVLSRGGGSDGATGLYYHARNEWSAPRGTGARPRIAKRALWVADADGVSPIGAARPIPASRPRRSPALDETARADAAGFGAPVPAGYAGPWPRGARRPAREATPRR